jgi:hypothetical protein
MLRSSLTSFACDGQRNFAVSRADLECSRRYGVRPARSSLFQHFANFLRAEGVGGEGEGAMLLHLAGGAQKGAEGGTAESATDADAPDT